MSLTSMTGFADLSGAAEGVTWLWEVRSVNGRGLDLRIRLPEGFETLEAPLREALSRRLSRGSVSVGLRFGAGARNITARLNAEALDGAITEALRAGDAASKRGLDLAPMTAADLLSFRGVLETEAHSPGENPMVMAALRAELEPLVEALCVSRVGEGGRLREILDAKIEKMAALAAAAREVAAARGAVQAETLRARLEAVLAATSAVDEARLAQELALLAVKSDVTEELDRLDAHVTAARTLVRAGGAVGRKLDFLTQEFNREANTLCSKAQAVELTPIGLDMKVVIDQMREQVQNVE